MSSETILVVDDDDAFRNRLVRAFQDRGHPAAAAGSAEEALQVAKQLDHRQLMS